MSMKRTKQRGSGSGRDQSEGVDFWSKPAEPERTWDEHMEGKADDAFVAYSLGARYTKGQLLTHPKFGKGVVVDVETSRVEILFQEGKKKLGHGQAS